MAYQPVPITPFTTGLNIDDDPFSLPMDAFTEITNGHIRHNHIEKRAGYTLLATVDSGSSSVMGLYTYYDNTNSRQLIAFNKTNAYTYNASSFTFTATDVGAIMGSGDSDFVWAVNWQSNDSTSTNDNRLYFTNGLPLAGGIDGIRYYDTSATTVSVAPFFDAGNTRQLLGGKLLFVLSKRLVVLNTIETSDTYPQRARFCAINDPSNWLDTAPGGGGFEDAPTGEQIVSARALQNQIIVFFTNSVWSLYQTSDPNRPLRWKKINDFRACDGKMASVSYDRYVAALGTRGITATDGVETRRVDDKIEDFVSNYVHADSFSQVFCLRDYNEQRFWTLYPRNEDDNSSGALIYDDDSSSWSLYDINLNVLGYADNGFDWKYSDFTGANNRDWTYSGDPAANEGPGESTYDDFYYQGNSETFIGGDTSGNVYILGLSNTDNGSDIPFSLTTGNWNPYEKEGVSCQMGYVDFFVESNMDTRFAVSFYKDNDQDSYAVQELDCLPDLGFVADLTNITQANPGVVTSNNHGLSTGDVIYIYGAQGMDAINDLELTVTVVDANKFSVDEDTSAFNAYTGGGMLFRRRFYRGKVWKRAYAGGVGYVHQMNIGNIDLNDSFKIFEYKPWFRKRGKRELG